MVHCLHGEGRTVNTELQGSVAMHNWGELEDWLGKVYVNNNFMIITWEKYKCNLKAMRRVFLSEYCSLCCRKV